MLISGRAAMLRECWTSGEETQKNSRYPPGAYQTGDTHGRPSASAVPSTM
jgi:hypothetical protein